MSSYPGVSYINNVRKNKKITREEWDEYAHNNCLFSAFTIACHKDAYSFKELIRKI